MNITVRDLLDAGVHFGHQRKRWNPKSKEFVYDHRHGVSIIDLEKSFSQLEKACVYLEDLVANDGTVLLVGTKRQAQEMIREAASATGMPYCASRWLGGTLTNFETIKRSLAKYKRYQAMETDGSLAKLPKKEGAMVKREMSRMHRNFEGIQDMTEPPAALFVIDIRHEDIAVAEANRLNVPVVALVDTNSDPTLVDYPIPGNDDAVKSIRVILDTVVEAIQNGLSQREARRSSKAASTAAAKSEITHEVASRLDESEAAAGEAVKDAEPEAAAAPEAEAEVIAPGLIADEADDLTDDEDELIEPKRPAKPKVKAPRDEDEDEDEDEDVLDDDAGAKAKTPRKGRAAQDEE